MKTRHNEKTYSLDAQTWVRLGFRHRLVGILLRRVVVEQRDVVFVPCKAPRGRVVDAVKDASIVPDGSKAPIGGVLDEVDYGLCELGALHGALVNVE